jgi:hypothetical protein
MIEQGHANHFPQRPVINARDRLLAESAPASARLLIERLRWAGVFGICQDASAAGRRRWL